MSYVAGPIAGAAGGAAGMKLVGGNMPSVLLGGMLGGIWGVFGGMAIKATGSHELPTG
jgi:hypothetical protein